MHSYNITTPINPELIKLDEPEKAKYSGIEANKETKILNSHGKLVSKLGRNIERHLDKVTIDKEKSAEKAKMHQFQKDMTKRRVALLTKDVQDDKDRSDHVDSILKLPDEIPSACTYVDKDQFERLVQSDTEIYLSYEIKRCKSGESLVELKKEVNRLKENNKLPITAIDSLNKKIKNQMAILVKAMPKHLKSIPYDGDPEKDFLMTRKKCNAVINLFNSAVKIDENLGKMHREEFRDMMIDTFSRDVKEVKKLCLARDNLRENLQLSKDINSLCGDIKPFFKQVSSHSEKDSHKIEASKEAALSELENQRKIIPNLVSRLNNELRGASEHIRAEAGYILEKNKLETKKTEQEAKREKAWKIKKPWVGHEIENTKKQIAKSEKRAEKMREEFQAKQIKYIHIYGELVQRLKQFTCINAIYDGLPPGEDVNPHPEKVLAAARGGKVTAPLQALHNMDTATVTGEFNYALGLQSFNESCIHNHFRNPAPEQPGGLNEDQINELQSLVKQVQSETSKLNTASGNQHSDIFYAYDQLVLAQIASDLAQQNKGDITLNQLKEAQALRFDKKAPLPLPDLVAVQGLNGQRSVTSDHAKTWPKSKLMAGIGTDHSNSDTSELSSSNQTWQVDAHVEQVNQPDDDYDDDDEDEWDEDDLTLNKDPAPEDYLASNKDPAPQDYLTLNKNPTPGDTQEFFKNDIIKETQEKHPDYAGEINHLGSHFLSWLNQELHGQYLNYEETYAEFSKLCEQLVQGKFSHIDIDDLYMELDRVILSRLPQDPGESTKL